MAQKDAEIAQLRAQLAGARAEVLSATSYAQQLTDERVSLMAKVNEGRAEFEKYKDNCLWAMKYLEQWKDRHCAQVDELRAVMEGYLSRQ